MKFCWSTYISRTNFFMLFYFFSKKLTQFAASFEGLWLIYMNRSPSSQKCFVLSCKFIYLCPVNIQLWYTAKHLEHVSLQTAKVQENTFSLNYHQTFEEKKLYLRYTVQSIIFSKNFLFHFIVEYQICTNDLLWTSHLDTILYTSREL